MSKVLFIVACFATLSNGQNFGNLAQIPNQIGQVFNPFAPGAANAILPQANAESSATVPISSSTTTQMGQISSSTPTAVDSNMAQSSTTMDISPTTNIASSTQMAMADISNPMDSMETKSSTSVQKGESIDIGSITVVPSNVINAQSNAETSGISSSDSSSSSSGISTTSNSMDQSSTASDIGMASDMGSSSMVDSTGSTPTSSAFSSFLDIFKSPIDSLSFALGFNPSDNTGTISIRPQSTTSSNNNVRRISSFSSSTGNDQSSTATSNQATGRTNTRRMSSTASMQSSSSMNVESSTGMVSNSTTGESVSAYNRRINGTQVKLGKTIDRKKYSADFLKSLNSQISNTSIYFDSCSTDSMSSTSNAIWMSDPFYPNTSSIVKYTLCPEPGIQPRLVTQFNLMTNQNLFGSKDGLSVGYACGKSSLDQSSCNDRKSISRTGCKSGFVLINKPLDPLATNATLMIVTNPQTPSTLTLCS